MNQWGFLANYGPLGSSGYENCVRLTLTLRQGPFVQSYLMCRSNCLYS